jgi:hypothetical protein
MRGPFRSHLHRLFGMHRPHRNSPFCRMLCLLMIAAGGLLLSCAGQRAFVPDSSSRRRTTGYAGELLCRNPYRGQKIDEGRIEVLQVERREQNGRLTAVICLRRPARAAGVGALSYRIRWYDPGGVEMRRGALPWKDVLWDPMGRAVLLGTAPAPGASEFALGLKHYQQ